METPTGSEAQRIVSPFADTAAALPRSERANRKTWIWIGFGLLFVIVGGVGGVFFAKRINDPLRTLEKFPSAKYLENHHAVAGARFRGDLRVEADLGWKEGVGRLMVFTAVDEARPLVVMIPAHLSNIYFTKGQTYVAELEVREGGLIYANNCRKY